MKLKSVVACSVIALVTVLPATAFSQGSETKDTKHHEGSPDKKVKTTSDQHEQGRGRMGGGETRQENAVVVRSASDVFKQVVNSEKITQEQLNRAQCIATFPNLTEAALGVGGQYGDGVVTCKTAQNQWSRPAFVDLVGASVGAQLGAKSTDLVLIFVNEKAKNAALNGNFTFGADLSVAGLGVDRSAAIDTNRSDILAYSRSEGLYAGAALDGTMVRTDEEANAAYYRQRATVRDILTNPAPQGTPQEAQQFVNTIQSSIRTPQR